LYVLLTLSRPVNEEAMGNYTGKERRSRTDRRERHVPFYKLLFFQGKRQTLRRAEDRRRIVALDQYHQPMMIPILIVLVLSLMDAVLTLILLDRGAVELNPVMRYYLRHGSAVFVMVKYGLTAVSMFIMVVIGAIVTSRWRLGSMVIPLCGALFGSVVIWELFLLAVSRGA
jgi:hypothetical protein